MLKANDTTDTPQTAKTPDEPVTSTAQPTNETVTLPRQRRADGTFMAKDDPDYSPGLNGDGKF